MHRDHKIFIQAIQDKKKVIIQHSNNNGQDVHTKVYRPLFYIPANSQKGSSQYYCWEDANGPKGNIVKIRTEQIIRIGPTQEPFEPTGFSLMNEEELLQKDSQLSNSSDDAK